MSNNTNIRELQGSNNIKRLLRLAFHVRLSHGMGLPLLLQGPPGGTKTSSVEAFAAEMGVKFFHLSPSQKGEGFFGVTPCRSTWNEQQCLEFPPPRELLEMNAAGHGLILVDELRTCPANLRAAMLSIVQERTFGSTKIHPGIRIMAASNSAQESAGGRPLDPATANRFAHVAMSDPSIDEFLAYYAASMGSSFDEMSDEDKVARRNVVAAIDKCIAAMRGKYRSGVASAVAAFARSGGSSVAKLTSMKYTGSFRAQPEASNPESDGPWQSPRSWGNLIETLTTYRAMKQIALGDLKDFPTELSSDVVSMARTALQELNFPNRESDDEELTTLLCGLVGSVAAALVNWIIEKDLPDPEDWLTGKVKFGRDEDGDRVFATFQGASLYVCSLNRDTPETLAKAKRLSGTFFALAKTFSVTHGAELVTCATNHVLTNAKVLTENKDATDCMNEFARIDAMVQNQRSS